MGAPKGNQFWKLRSEHGRDKLFSSPNTMWDAACEYFEWCEENPLLNTEAKVVSNGNNMGSTIEKVDLPKIRAFTLIGLCHFLGVNTDYFTDFRDSLKGKDDENSKDFSRIVKRIYETIYQQKFEGAAAGLLSSAIIARDLGLADKTDITSAGKEIQSTPIINVYTDKAPPLADSEAGIG